MRSTLLSAVAAAAFLPVAALAADHTVFFNFDSARLTDEGRSVVQQAAADYMQTGETSVSVVGHTDTVGTADYNLALSERRARTVTEALVALGVPTSSMTVGWRGEAEPAVATGEGVREQANRRVEIAIAEPSVTAPAPVVQPTVEEVVTGLRLSAGPFVAFNMEDGDNSIPLGVNFTAAYDITENLALTAEQAVFYNLEADDEGVGGRSALGAELAVSPFDGLATYVGAQGGYMYIDGTGTGGWFAGPKAGVRFQGFEIKAAYDIVEDRDWEEGVVSVTAGYNLRF